MTVEEIRELINLAKETGVASLDVQRGEDRVRIRVSPLSHIPKVSGPMAALQLDPAQPAADANVTLVRSPIVGTFYESPSPDTPPFVRVGEKVQPGKVLCIIESMKLMNEIEAEVTGTLESKLVMNGQPVEYGEALFGIRPL